MAQEGITQIDVKQVLQQKAPSVAGKIPGCMVNYLIRTIHQDEQRGTGSPIHWDV